MKIFHLKQGLNLPFLPHSFPLDKDSSKKIFYQQDFPGLDLKVCVEEGQSISPGKILLQDKKRSDLSVKAFFTGKVSTIIYGDKKKFISLTIENIEKVPWKENFSKNPKEFFLQSTLWNLLRQRPFDIIPSPESLLENLFIQGCESYTGESFKSIIYTKTFQEGLSFLKKIFKRVFLIGRDFSDNDAYNFSGKHPSGLIGTHIHYLSPVTLDKKVEHLQVEDVWSIGNFILTGYFSLPRYIRYGKEFLQLESFDYINQKTEGFEFIVGHPLYGEKRLSLSPKTRHLSSIQIENKDNDFNWLKPLQTFSVTNFSVNQLDLNTSTQGEERSFIPLDFFYEVFPLRMEIPWLLRSILVQDEDLAIDLGLLELVEEDFALVSFVDPTKHDFMYKASELLKKIKDQL